MLKVLASSWDNFRSHQKSNLLHPKRLPELENGNEPFESSPRPGAETRHRYQNINFLQTPFLTVPYREQV
ncbi:unnamed protein product [Diplocarpon coronariae]